MEEGDALAVELDVGEHAVARDADALGVSKQPHPILVGIAPYEGGLDLFHFIENVSAADVADVEDELGSVVAQRSGGGPHGVCATFRVTDNSKNHGRGILAMSCAVNRAPDGVAHFSRKMS